MSALRVALAGAGMVSRHHLIAWSKLSDAQVVAIADPEGAKAAGRAREFGIPAVFADVARMLDETRPDAIDIVGRDGSDRRHNAERGASSRSFSAALAVRWRDRRVVASSAP